MKQIKLLLVDDHIVTRIGVRMMVSVEPSIRVVGEAGDGWGAIQQAKKLRPDVIFMDLMLADGEGIWAIAEIKRRWPQIKMIVLTSFEDEARIKAAMAAGADGYLLKDADGEAILQAIHTVQCGGMPLHPRVAQHVIKRVTTYKRSNGSEPLTEREQEILRLLTQGLSNKAIAQAVNLSEGTIKIYVSHILDKLNITSRTEAAMLAVHIGLVSFGAGDTVIWPKPFGVGDWVQ